MPAASSKPAPQTTLSEGQDPLKQLVGIVDKKIRNLEKRKTKLDGYRATVKSGKTLNKDQEEAVSHFDEVSASLEFAKELSKSFAVVLNEVTVQAAKAHKKEAKREKQQRHEQSRERISDVLLLQNVLYHMGQDHVRADFLAGTNGALNLEEEELNHLDELFKLVNPSREETEESTETSNENKSFDKKLELATNHLDSYLNEDEKEVCGTTYKELNLLVHRIHRCGYLDKIPPVEEAPEAAPEEVAPAPYEPPEEEFEEKYTESTPDYEETPNEVTTDSYYAPVSSDQMPPPAMTSVPLDVNQMPSSMAPEQQQQQQQLSDITPQSRVLSSSVVDVPPAPEPIEMPPPKQTHRDVNELLAPVLGSFNFVQDSMLDYDSPHMDPAVVAVSQPFIPSSTFTNNVQASASSTEKLDQSSQPGVMDHQTLADTLSAQQSMGTPSQLTTEQTSYQSQPRYDSSQQNYASQGLPDQSAYSQQTLDSTTTGFGTQQDLTSTSSVKVEYGSSQTSNELPEFPSPPVDTQLSKQEEPSVLQGGSTSLQSTMLNQQTLSHTSSQYGTSGLAGNEGFSPTLGSNQLAGDSVTSSLSSQMTQGSSSSPLTITDPSQATIPLPGEQPTTEVTQGPIPPSKSTMNASAPPFQMTNSMRSSPQMQQMQSSPPNQVGQSQDMGTFQSLDQSQDYDHSSSGDVDRTHSPSQDNKLDQPVVHPNDPPVSSYAGYQPYYRNGRGNKRGGPNPGFRTRGGSAPFMRGNQRYATPQQPRGPGAYNAYVQRDTFTPRGPDLSYNPNARYGSFNQMQEQNYYNRRGGMPRGGPRGGGRGAPPPRSQPQFRGGRGSFGKPTPQVSV